MAKVKLAAFMSDLRGKVENAVYQKSSAGLSLRGRVVPFNPKSTAQINARSVLSGASTSFGLLSDSQILAWNELAKTIPPSTNVFGESYLMSGANAHSMIQANLSKAEYALIPSAPEAYTACKTPDMSLTTLTSTPLSSNLVLDMPDLPVGTVCIVSMAQQCSPGRNNPVGSYRKVGMITSNPIVALELQDMYESAFGSAPTFAKKVFVRLSFVNTFGFGRVGSDFATKVR